jgi:hypothetical protein
LAISATPVHDCCEVINIALWTNTIFVSLLLLVGISTVTKIKKYPTTATREQTLRDDIKEKAVE